MKRAGGAGADDRGRRLRRPGRRRRDPAPRAERRHRRRPAGLSQSARAGRARPRGGERALDTDMPVALQVRRAPRPPPAGAERLPDRPGRLRQILHLLRRALYARRRDLAARSPRSSTRRRRWSMPAPGRSPCSARTSTPGATRTAAASTALIRALDALPGLARIRYTTSHPNDMTEGLIRAHAEVEKLMPFLHLPVQSGSDRILKAMNRSHSARQLSAHHRARPRRPARHRHLGRFHRRLPRRDRRRVRGDAANRRRR